MNAKKTKQLRKTALAVSQGLPSEAYWRRGRTVELQPRCAKAVYRELKHRAAGTYRPDLDEE